MTEESIAADMPVKRNEGSAQRTLRNGWLWAPIPALLFLMATAVMSGPEWNFEAEQLVIGAEYLFSTLVSGLVAWVCGRSFLRIRSIGILLLGCSTLIWGLSPLAVLSAALVHGYRIEAASVAEIDALMMTGNILMWLSALCGIVGAAWIPRWGKAGRYPFLWTLAAYGLAVCVATSVVFSEGLPDLFESSAGGSRERDILLVSTAFMFVLSAKMLNSARRHVQRFVRLYGMALLIYATGYMALLLEVNSGQSFGWITMAARSVSGIYMLAAIYPFLGRDRAAEIMSEQQREGGWNAYGIALALVLTCAVIRAIFLHELGERAMFVTLLPAVMLASLYGGFWVGMFATVASLATVAYVWKDPSIFSSGAGFGLMVLFAFIGLFVSWISYIFRMMDARLRKAEAVRREDLERLVVQRTAELSRQIRVRKEVEEALIAALDEADRHKAELATILEVAPVGISITRDMSCGVITGNKAAEALLHLSGGNISARQGKSLPFTTVDEQGETIPLAMLPMERAIRGETVRGVEFGLVFEDGSLRRCYTNAEPLRDAHGRIRGAVMAFVDITRLKNTERWLRESRDRLSFALEAGGMGVFEKNCGTGESRWSDETARMLGYEPGSVIPSQDAFIARLGPEDREPYIKKITKCLQTGCDLVADYRLNLEEPSSRWIECRGRVSCDAHGKPRTMYGVIIDITERKRAEEALRRSQQQMETFVRHAPVSMAMFDATMNYLACSDRWLERNKCGHESLIGVNQYKLFPEMPERWKEIHREGLSGKMLSADEDIWICADGRKDWLRWAVVPWRDENEAVGGIIVYTEDITERKRMIEELRESEARFRAAQEASLDAFVIYEPVLGDKEVVNLKVVYANRMAAAYYGYLPEDMEGRLISEVIPSAKDPGGLIERHGRIITSGEPEEYTLRYDSPRIAGYFRNLVVPFGPYVGTTFRDVTELRRAERALRESEERARLLEETLTQGVIYRDQKGRIVRVNPAAEHILGRTHDELTNEGLEDLKYNPICEDGTPFPIDEHPASIALRTGKVVSKVVMGVFNPRMNMIRWLIVEAVPLFHPGETEPYEAYAVFSDVTHLKQAEQALRESEKRSRMLENTLTQGVVYRDRTGKIVRVNPAAERILGRSMDELVAYSLEELGKHCIREDGTPFPEEEQPVYVALKTGKTVSNAVLGEFNPRLNMYRWLIIDSAPLFRPGENEPYEAYSIFSDITETVEANKALSAAKAEAERANLAKSKFLAAASHDLRQPVQSLALLLSALERYVAKRPQALKTMDMMKTAVDGLSSLLNGILDISRLDADMVIPSIEDVDVGKMVKFLAREYAPAAIGKNLEIRVGGGGGFVWSDPALLERILRNLIENALRYTQKGGVIVGCRKRGRFIRIDVVDTGIGIPADKQQKIFEEFYQVRSPVYRGEQGMGLGLSIVSRVARLLGADVQVASRLDKGSRFSIVLPTAENAAPEEVEVQAATESPGGRILIIEDNAVLREGFTLVLETWGYSAIPASSGEEAIEKAEAEEWKIDAVISDYQLGRGFNGIKTVKEMERRSGRTYPAIVITGDTASDDIAKTHASGYAVLHKPIRAEDLREALAKLLVQADKEIKAMSA
ncbi:MAG: PAS domain S-box protein [Alphaproteobacteria bacterium]|nr:PAS domain S-box protein [Alphaproteobacteria bacterium]